MPDDKLMVGPPLPTHRGISAVNTASLETNVPPVAPVSPTGSPIVPQSWVRWLVLAGAVAALPALAVSIVTTAGAAVPAWLATAALIGGSITSLLAAFGIASPGWRAPQPPAPTGPAEPKDGLPR